MSGAEIAGICDELRSSFQGDLFNSPFALRFETNGPLSSVVGISTEFWVFGIVDMVFQLVPSPASRGLVNIDFV